MLLLLETMNFLLYYRHCSAIGEHLLYSTVTTYCVIQRLIQHCLLSKMVYLNIKYVIATRSYEFLIYTQNLIGNITLAFEGYYICSRVVHQTMAKIQL